jgi:hypothetical protein
MKVMMVWPPQQAYPEALHEVCEREWLNQVQTIVGGYIAQVPLYGYRFITSEDEPVLKILSAWADEDGRAKGLRTNVAASRYFGTHLVGHVAIIAEVAQPWA